MENSPEQQPNEQDKINSELDGRSQMVFMLSAALMAKPELAKMYPQISNGIDMLSNGIDTYLGDNEKMIVLVRKNGVTRAIELNPKIAFTISNEMKLEATENPVVNNYEKEEWKQKLLDSVPIQMIKEKYEKMGYAEDDKANPKTDFNPMALLTVK